MANVWQNILACDAIVNPYRVNPNNPCLSISYKVYFKAMKLSCILNVLNSPNLYIESLYLRRRALLLQDKSTESSGNESTRRAYLQMRSTILYQRYGIAKEVLCSRSRSVSLRSSQNVSTTEKNSATGGQEEGYMDIQQMLDHVSLNIYLYFR